MSIDLSSTPDGKLIEVFLQLRAKRDAAKAEFKKQQRPLLDAMDKVLNELLSRLNKTGLNNISTTDGTAYRSKRVSTRIEDKEAFRNFVQQGHWEMLDMKANSPAVEEWMEAHGAAPPGVVSTRESIVNVRSK